MTVQQVLTVCSLTAGTQRTSDKKGQVSLSVAAFMKPIEMAESNMVLKDACKRMAQVGLLLTEKVESQSLLCIKPENGSFHQNI